MSSEKLETMSEDFDESTSRYLRLRWMKKKTSYRYTLNPIYLSLKKDLTLMSEYGII